VLFVSSNRLMLSLDKQPLASLKICVHEQGSLWIPSSERSAKYSELQKASKLPRLIFPSTANWKAMMLEQLSLIPMVDSCIYPLQLPDFSILITATVSYDGGVAVYMREQTELCILVDDRAVEPDVPTLQVHNDTYRSLMANIDDSLSNHDLLRSVGLEPVKGIVLYGPRGVGKSHCIE
jgi:hypothetical protein